MASRGKSNRKKKVRHDKKAYKNRNVVERCLCRLKDFKRISARYDTLVQMYKFLFDLTDGGNWLVDVPPGGLFDGNRHDGVFDVRRHPVLQDGFAPRDLLQAEFAAFIVMLLEAVEAVAALAHYLAGLRNIAAVAGAAQPRPAPPPPWLKSSLGRHRPSD
jgi:hypothetical protein